jgi:hypothetical protein
MGPQFGLQFTTMRHRPRRIEALQRTREVGIGIIRVAHDALSGW